MGDLIRPFGDVNEWLEKVRAKTLEQARSEGFDTIEAWEQAKADAAAKAWDDLESEAIAWARALTLEHSGTLIAAVDAKAIASGSMGRSKAIDAAQRWLRGDRPMLILCGPPGTGKSVAAAWAIVEQAKADIQSTWNWTVSEVGNGGTSRPGASVSADFARRAARGHGVVVHASRIPQTFDPWRGETLDDRPELRWDVPFLVIDDLGTEQSTARWEEAFGHLIDERLASARCRTIITTNISKANIRGRYGDRIADRWNAHAVAVELKGESMRGKGQGL